METNASKLHKLHHILKNDLVQMREFHEKLESSGRTPWVNGDKIIVFYEILLCLSEHLTSTFCKVTQARKLANFNWLPIFQSCNLVYLTILLITKSQFI